MTKIGIAYGFYRGNWIGRNTSELFELLKQEFGARNLAVQKIGLLDTEVRITNGQLDVIDIITGESLSALAGMYFANWRKNPEFALAAAELMLRAGKPILSHEVLQVMPMTKLGELVLLSGKNIAVPDSIVMRSKYWLQRLQGSGDLPFATPFIVKAVDGSMGANNHLVNDTQQLQAILSQDKQSLFVVQQFIPNNCDYRVIIIGGEAKLVIRRSRSSDDTHLNNTSQGAHGQLVPLVSMPPEVLAMALTAAAAVRRPSFAGVDIIQDSTTGKYYVLEVNKTPQMETGTNTEQKVEALVSYFTKELS